MARSSLDEMAWQINWADLTDVELADLAGQVATVATDSGTFALAPWGPFGPTLMRSDQVYGLVGAGRGLTPGPRVRAGSS